MAISFRRSNAAQPLLDRPSERIKCSIARCGISISIVGIAAALSGCSPGVPFDDPFSAYTQRTLTVSPTAGNAQAANLAIQTSTPWPRYSQYTSIPGDGPVMVKAVQHYESGNNGGPSAGGSDPAGAAPAGASSSPAAPPAN